ncbi:hypothetical protein AYO44_07260 [Planctomycetaceae bacterium SCGC AG-212-F19]|nr:hypothetical protein AYO44_07260 [Planctomycetaceae bacterium SCGC AG-212-F19]
MCFAEPNPEAAAPTSGNSKGPSLPAGAVAKFDGRAGVSIAFSPDGRVLATGGLSTIELWEAATGNRIRELTGHEGSVCSLAFSGDGKLLASGSADHTIRLWEVATEQELAHLKGHADEVRSVCFSPDGQMLASGSGDQSVRLWEVHSGKEIRAIAFDKWVYTVAFAPDGKHLAVGSMDKSIRLVDTATGKRIETLTGHKSFVYSLAFAPDGKLLASAGQDRTVRLWDPASGQPVCVLHEEEEAIPNLAFSRDGRTLAAITLSGQIFLWEVVSRQPVRIFPGPRPLLKPAVAFAPDGRSVATTGGVFTALLWDRTGLRTAKRAGPSALSAQQLETLWSDLASTDAGVASEALWTLVSDPEKTLRAMPRWLEPVAVDAKRIAQLIADLDGDRFPVRQKASAELAAIGPLARPALEKALAGNPSLEVRQRIEELLKDANAPLMSPQTFRQVRAVAVLEHIGTSEARALLRKLADGADGARQTQEAKAALRRLESNGTP